MSDADHAQQTLTNGKPANGKLANAKLANGKDWIDPTVGLRLLNRHGDISLRN